MLSRRRRRSVIAEPLRDRDLVRLYWRVALRPAFDALFDLDDAMAEVVTSATQPALAAIKLAWWRDALEALDHKPPPPERRLQAAATHLIARGIGGTELAGLEAGWATLLDECPDRDLVERRGSLIFSIAARLLASSDDRLDDLGREYAVAAASRRTGQDLRAGLGASGAVGAIPVRLRPLTALAVLAGRDLRRGFAEPEATPARAFALLAHRLTGAVR